MTPYFDQSTGAISNNMSLNFEVNDRCWICEGWVPLTFEYTPGVSQPLVNGEKPDPLTPLYLHLEQDYFKPDLMLPDDPKTPVKWQSTRMVAPGRTHNYFFSTEGRQFIAED